MICTMLYHQTWISSSAFFSWMQMLGYIGVEVFLFLSGFGIVHSLRKNPLREYYKNRVIRLLPACILFGLSKIVLSCIPTMPSSHNLILDLFSLSHWYIYAISIYYLISPVLYRMMDKWGGCVFFVIILISYIIICYWQYDAGAPYLIKYGRWIVKRFPVFIFGMLIAIHPVKWRISIMTLIGLVFVSLNIWVFHYIILANASSTVFMDLPIELASMLPDRTVIPDNGRYLLDMMSVLFLIPCFSFLAYVTQKVHVDFVMDWIGKYSLEIYLCHQYIYEVIVKHCAVQPFFGVFTGISVSFAAAFIIRILSNPLRMVLIKVTKL